MIAKRNNCCAALALIAATSLVSGAPAHSQTISTLADELGIAGLWGRAPGGVESYGQTFTISDRARLDRVTFRIRTSSNISFDLHVFRWDPGSNRATGVSFGNVPGTVIGIPSGVNQSAVVDTGGFTLPSAGQYVVFLQATTMSSAFWAFTGGDAYLEGQTVNQDNDGDISQWTGAAWAERLPGSDFAFELILSDFPTADEEMANFAPATSNLGRIVSDTAHRQIGMRSDDSFATRDRVLAILVPSLPVEQDEDRFIVTASAMDHSPLAGNVYTWIDVTGFEAEDDTAGRSFSGRGIQAGADLALSPDLLLGLSIGWQDLSASLVGTQQSGHMRFVQPYLAYRMGAWSGAVSVMQGFGDYTQTSIGGTGQGETRLTALRVTAGYDMAMGDGVTLTPTLGLAHGVEKVRGLSGTLAGAPTQTVRFTEASLGAQVSRARGTGAVFAGLSADWLDSSAGTVQVTNALVDEGWTGSLDLGVTTALGRRVEFQTSLSISGLGGDLRQTSGAVNFAFRF